LSVAGRVLVDGDQAGRSAAFNEDFANAMAGSLGRGHAHVNVLGGDDGLVVNIETVREHEHLAGTQVGTDLFGVQLGLGLIGNQDHDHIAPLGNISDGADFKTGLLRLDDGPGGGRKADLHLNAGILQVESMGMPLGAIADDGDLLGLDEGEVSILIVISFYHDFLGFPLLG